MRYKNNQSIFLNEDAISYYLLGVYMSDGTITNNNRKRFELTSKDHDWIKSIKDLISPDRPIYVARKHYRRLAISDKEIVEWLVKNGCTPRKSLTLKMPTVPDEHLPDFVRGYFDGDGSVTFCNYQKRKNNKIYKYKKFTAYICSGSQSFIESLADLISYNDICGCVSELKSKPHFIKGKYVGAGIHWRLSFGDRTALKFTNWTHYDGHAISMPRKFDKIQEAKKHYETKS